MLGALSFSQKEQAIVLELLNVLQVAPDATSVAPVVFPLLNKLIAADHFAIALSRTPDFRVYDFGLADVPSDLFRNYEHVGHHDFVRLAVAQKPNIVLTDADILAGQDRALVQRNPFYQATRELHMPVEQVLAVMMKRGPAPKWIGGLTLYRDKARPFTARERDIFQILTGYFGNMMDTCKRFALQGLALTSLEQALRMARTGWLLFDSSWRWLAGANEIESVFARCFGGGNRAPDGLPLLLRNYIDNLANQLSRSQLPTLQPVPWIPPRKGSGVLVSFTPLVHESDTQWQVMLDEIPALWRAKLSPAEIDVAVRVAQGWDYTLVAKELGISPTTVPKHLNNIFTELGVEGREALIAKFRSRN